MIATQFVSIITIKGNKSRIDQRVLGDFQAVIKERETAAKLFVDGDENPDFTQKLLVRVDGEVREQAVIDIDGNITLKKEPTQCIQCRNIPGGDDPVYVDGECPSCGIQVTIDV
jgi:hypothetical protein